VQSCRFDLNYLLQQTPKLVRSLIAAAIAKRQLLGRSRRSFAKIIRFAS